MCTPRYFAAIQRAFVESEHRAWERARYIGFLSILPHSSSKRALKPTDLGRFPWEKTKVPAFPPMRKAEMDAFRQRAIEVFKQRGITIPENGDNK